MGILTISLDSLWFCEPVGGRKKRAKLSLQRVLQQRNSADVGRTKKTLTWQVTAALDEEPPHAQAPKDEDEDGQTKGDGEN